MSRLRRPQASDRPLNPRMQELVALESELGLRRESARDRERVRSARMDGAAPAEEPASTPTERLRLADFEQRCLEARSWARGYVEQLLGYAPWNGMAAGSQRARLEKILLHHTRRRSYKRGELVIRQGDFGNSAWFVLQGTVRIVLATAGREGLSPAELHKTEGARIGWWGALKNWMLSPGREVRDPSALRREYLSQDRSEEYVPIFLQDVPRVLENHRTVQLGPGELFGEIAAVARLPRTATVFASGEEEDAQTELLEIRWQGLHELIRSDPSFKEHVYSVYRRNSLRAHLRNTPFLARIGASDAIRASIRSCKFRELFVERLGWEARRGPAVASGALTPLVVYQLRVVEGPDKGTVLELQTGKGPTVVGRDPASDLVLAGDTQVAAQHAILEFQHQRLSWLLSNRAQRGTTVEGRLVRGWLPLKPGSRFVLGASTLVFELTTPSALRLQSARSAGDTFRLEPIAELPGTGGGPGIVAFCCRGSSGMPGPEARKSAIEHIARQCSRWFVVVFVDPGGVRQTWAWQLPGGSATEQLLERELTIRSRSGPSRELCSDLLRNLLLERIGRETTFQSYGEFGWALQEDAPEPVIAAEGHYPNGVTLMRAGFARVQRGYNQGQRTLEYLTRGDAYGFEEIAHNWLNRQQQEPPMLLQRTLAAMGYVDVLFIATPIIERFVLPSYSVDQLRDAAAAVRLLVAASQPGSGGVPGGPPQGLLEFITEQRVFNGTSAMVIDLDRCTRCDDCVRACSSAHFNNPRFIRHGPSYGNLQIANACMHCADPVCMIGCPTGAIHRNLSGEVVIGDATCIGCSTCANNCPYDNIRMVDIRDPQGELLRDGELIHQRATKCDLCHNQPAGPACVRACPHEALQRVDLTRVSNMPGA